MLWRLLLVVAGLLIALYLWRWGRPPPVRPAAPASSGAASAPAATAGGPSAARVLQLSIYHGCSHEEIARSTCQLHWF